VGEREREREGKIPPVRLEAPMDIGHVYNIEPQKMERTMG